MELQLEIVDLGCDNVTMPPPGGKVADVNSVPWDGRFPGGAGTIELE